MSIRRLERVALSHPVVLKAIAKLSLPESSVITSDFQSQFLPMLRYSNPMLAWELNKTNQVEIVFQDSTKEIVHVQQSHVLMERLISIDAQKHFLKDKYIPE